MMGEAGHSKNEWKLGMEFVKVMTLSLEVYSRLCEVARSRVARFLSRTEMAIANLEFRVYIIDLYK